MIPHRVSPYQILQSWHMVYVISCCYVLNVLSKMFQTKFFVNCLQDNTIMPSSLVCVDSHSQQSAPIRCCSLFSPLPLCRQVIVGIVVLVDPGSIPINARGEKQRMHLRDSFLNDELDPIYVAYNL